MDLPAVVDTATRDLDVVAARLDVVHGEGWWPAQPDRDRPTGPPTHGDSIPGAPRDCGLASYQARQAWEALTGHLDAAAHATALTLAAAARRPPPAPVSRTGPATLDATAALIPVLRRRLDGLRRLHQAVPHWEPLARWFEVELLGRPGHPHGSPCWHIEQARHRATGIVAIVGTGKRPPPCGRCRRPGTVGDPRRKGWCAACYRAWYRGDTARRGRSLTRTRRPANLADVP